MQIETYHLRPTPAHTHDGLRGECTTGPLRLGLGFGFGLEYFTYPLQSGVSAQQLQHSSTVLPVQVATSPPSNDVRLKGAEHCDSADAVTHGAAKAKVAHRASLSVTLSFLAIMIYWSKLSTRPSCQVKIYCNISNSSMLLEQMWCQHVELTTHIHGLLFLSR